MHTLLIVQIRCMLCLVVMASVKRKPGGVCNVCTCVGVMENIENQSATTLSGALVGYGEL